MKSEPFKRDLSIPGEALVAIIDALLPLCQQVLYSKSENISRAGESALLYLSQIDPVSVCPPFDMWILPYYRLLLYPL